MTQFKDRATKPRDRGLWGRKTEGQASFGVDSGSLRGDPGETLGGQRGGGGGHRRPNCFFHFRGFKILKLCENLSLLLKRLEINLNQFLMDCFSESCFFRVFSGATCTNISDFFF